MKRWEINLTELPLEGEEKENLKKFTAIEKKYVEGHIVLENTGDSPVEFLCGNILVKDKNLKNLQISFKGSNLKNSGGCLYINGHPVTLNALANMEITPPTKLNITILY